MNWHKVLLLFLWVSPHVLLGALAVILWKRRLYQKFPCFFAFVLYEIVEFILLFSVRPILGVSRVQYSYIYYATLMLSIALCFGVIDEVAKVMLQESRFFNVTTQQSLRYLTGLLLVIGVLLAIYAPGNNRVWWVAAASVIDRGAAMVQCGLLIILLLFSLFSGLSWRRPALGIALGLTIMVSVDLVIRALRAEFRSDAWVPYLDLLATGTYLVCVAIWIRYLLAPELEPSSPTVVSYDEVEIWNRELHQFLRH